MEVVKDLRRLFPTVLDRAYEQSKEFRRVSDIMSPDVITISPEASMDEASKTMGDKHIGSLIVMKNGEPIGLVAESDVLSHVLA